MCVPALFVSQHVLLPDVLWHETLQWNYEPDDQKTPGRGDHAGDMSASHWQELLRPHSFIAYPMKFDVMYTRSDVIKSLQYDVKVISRSVEGKFGLVGKPRVPSIDFNRSNGAEVSTWNMPGAAPLDPLLCGNTAYGNKWVNELQPFYPRFLSVYIK